MNLTFTWTERLTVDGDGTTEDAATLFEAALLGAPDVEGRLCVDLFGLDLDTGQATVAWHQTVRMLRDHFGAVTLLEAPQMLAHSLYKVGDLTDGRIRLVSPRSDEGISSN